MHPPKLSVVTINYNTTNGLYTTAASLRTQTFKDFEWLVIDGGSSDGFERFVKENYDIINYWVSEKDYGIADGWNKGITKSKGDYILILNSGDEYDIDFLSLVANNITDAPKILCFGANIISLDGRFIKTFWAEPRKLENGMFIPHNWAAVPKIFYIDFGLYKNLKFSMDYEWFLRVYCKSGGYIFKEFKISGGNFHLGGHSDKNYLQSFLRNYKIQKEHGIPLGTRIKNLLSLSLKHFLKFKFIK